MQGEDFFFLFSLMREAFFSGLARWQLPMAMYRPYAEAGPSPQCFARKLMAVFPAYDLQGERCCDPRDPRAPTLHAGRIGLQQQAMVGGYMTLHQLHSSRGYGGRRMSS